MKRVSISKVLIRSGEGKYLVLRGSVWPERPDRSQQPDIPGGMVDEGESNAQAAVREVFEEAGIVIREEQLDLIYARSFMKEDKDEAVVWLLYLVDIDETPEVKISWEHEGYWWYSAEEVLNLKIRDPYPEVLSYLHKIDLLT